MKKLYILTICLVIGISLQAQTHKYYAGFIYNFTKNMNWDASKQSGDFIIAVIGTSPITPYLEQLAASKTVNTQKIVIKRVSSASDAMGAHVIFLSASQSSQLNTAIVTANTNKALLVSESTGLGTKGSAMNFIDNGGRVGFEINKKALKSAKVKINSKLEALGKVVG